MSTRRLVKSLIRQTAAMRAALWATRCPRWALGPAIDHHLWSVMTSNSKRFQPPRCTVWSLAGQVRMRWDASNFRREDWAGLGSNRQRNRRGLRRGVVKALHLVELDAMSGLPVRAARLTGESRLLGLSTHLGWLRSPFVSPSPRVPGRAVHLCEPVELASGSQDVRACARGLQ